MGKQPSNERDAILITGPTAGGKSALAIDLASRHDGVIVNADSMQVYDVLSVVTARPEAQDLQHAEHRLYGHVAPSDVYSTGRWLTDIAAELQDLRAAGRLPIIIGGTGLYFRALTGGLAEMPPVPDDIRLAVRERLLTEGPEASHQRLAGIDPVSAAKIGPADAQRIARALELHAVTGEPPSRLMQRGGPMLIDPARAEKIIVLPDRAVLAGRINRRFETMMDRGAIEEVQALLALGLPADRPAMKAIGVPEIAAMLNGTMSRADAVERASAATRQYAKRQMTWFRNQMDESWKRMEP